MKNLALVVNREGEIWSPQGLVAHTDSKRELEMLNSLGVEQTLTTLSTVLPEIIEQKYYEVPLADYVDIAVGQGNPFSNELYNWATGIEGSDFESGLINQASNQSNTMADDIAVEPIKRKVIGWKKNVSYNILQEGTFTAGTQNMDYVQAKYRARKKQYDLGIQDMFFWGLKSDNEIKGLLNQANATINTTLITKKLSAMTSAEFQAFIAGFLKTFQTNNNYTAMPNRFVIPQDDYLGLTAFVSETYPVAGSTRIEVLENAVRKFVPDFKVLGSAYAIKANNAKITGLNKDRYVLYKKASDTIKMDIPLDFTVTLPGTANNFDYISAAYSRFTGVNLFRDKELMYFDINE